MKNFRELCFEPLEKRELLASDVGHFAHLPGHRDLDAPVIGDFEHAHDMRSESRFDSDLGSHGHTRSNSDRVSEYSRHRSMSLAFTRPWISIELSLASSQSPRAEGEASSLSRPLLLRTAQSSERITSIIVVSDRLVFIPLANTAPASIALERFIPTSFRASNATGIDSSALNSSQTPGQLAPNVELPNTSGFAAKSMENHMWPDIRRSDEAIVEWALDEGNLLREKASSHLANSNITVDVPVPSGMISLDLASGIQAFDRNASEASSLQKSTVGRPESIFSRSDSLEPRRPSESVAILKGGLPIPAGMIYLDFASRLASTAGSATPHSQVVLQAGINPLTLFQAFINSQPLVASAPSQASEAREPNHAANSDSNTLSWSTVGAVAALSGLFFALAPGRARKVRSDR